MEPLGIDNPTVTGRNPTQQNLQCVGAAQVVELDGADTPVQARNAVGFIRLL